MRVPLTPHLFNRIDPGNHSVLSATRPAAILSHPLCLETAFVLPHEYVFRNALKVANVSLQALVLGLTAVTARP